MERQVTDGLEPSLSVMFSDPNFVFSEVMKDFPINHSSLVGPTQPPTTVPSRDDATSSVTPSASPAQPLSPSSPRTTVTAATTAVSSRRFPSDLKTIVCTWPGCDKAFNRPARLTAHLRSHTNDRPFRCPHAPCDKAYLEEKHLRQHIKGSHTHERRYTCATCDKAFLTATRLRRHAAVHEGQDRFRCRGHDPACTRTFRKHQTLQRHIRTEHLRAPAFVCAHEGCHAAFDGAGALRRHGERAHGAPKFWCAECAHAAGFATRALLDAHMRGEHARCFFCDARCAGPAALHQHMDMHHSGKTVAERKTAACPHAGCGKTFTRRSNLNVHIRAAHEGLRYVCGVVVGEDDDDDDDEENEGPKAEGRFPHHHHHDDDDDDPDRAAWDAATHGCGRGFVSRMKLEEHIRYVHLRRPRPPAAAAAAVTMMTEETTGGDLLDTLAGTNRTLACPHAATTGCALRFARHHDLQTHLQRAHGRTAACAAAPMALSFTPAAVFSAATAPSSLLAQGGSRGSEGGAGAGVGVGVGDMGDLSLQMDLGLGRNPNDDDDAHETVSYHEDVAAAAAAASASFWDLRSGADALVGDAEAAAEADALVAMFAKTDDDDDDDDDRNGDQNANASVQRRLADAAQWQMDEAEMRRLIGDDGHGGSLLDPNLFL